MTDTSLSDAGVVAGSFQVAAWTTVSRVTGLARAAVVAAVLGPTYLANLFQATNMLPNLVYEIFAGSLIASLLVPPLVRHISARQRDDVERVARGFLGVVLAGFVALTVVIIALGPLVLRLLALGITNAGTAREQTRLGWPLLAMLMPQVALYGVAATGVAVMNAHRRFALAAAAPAFENAGVIATLVLLRVVYPHRLTLTGMRGAPLLVLGVGTTAAVVLHAGAQWFGARAVGVTLLPRAGWRDPELKTVIDRTVRSLGYASLSGIRLFAGLVVANRFAGGVVAFQLGLTFFWLPTALAGRPVAVALLPHLSQLHHDGEERAFRDEFVGGAALMAFVVVPAAVGYAVLSGVIARAVSYGAMAGSGGPSLVAAALLGLAAGVVGESSFILVTHASYARHDASTPLRAMVAGVVLTFVLMGVAFAQGRAPALLLVLGLSFSAGGLVSTAYAAVALARQLPSGARRLLPSLVRTGVAAAVMALPAWAVGRGVAHAAGRSSAASVAAVLVAVVVGAVAYFIVQRLARAPELALIRHGWRSGDLGTLQTG